MAARAQEYKETMALEEIFKSDPGKRDEWLQTQKRFAEQLQRLDDNGENERDSA